MMVGLVAGMLLTTMAGGAALAHTGGATAYGQIYISDDGTGPQATTTYDPQFWSCGFTINQNPPTVTCDPTGTPSGTTHWDCTWMVLTATAMHAPGAVRGEVECNPTKSLSTGDVVATGSTPAANTASDDLGVVGSIVCQAYGVNGTDTPVPPYNVTCNEPGPPSQPLLSIPVGSGK